MLYTCCNFSRNTCQRNVCCGNATTVTTTGNCGCGNTTVTNTGCGYNGTYGIFIPLSNRYYWARTCGGYGTTTTNGNNGYGCGNYCVTPVTTNGNCGCRNLCATGTTTTVTPLNGDAYYARQYGLYGNNGYGCGY